MPVHPDNLAHRAVDACGGTYTASEVDSGYRDGHKDALDSAIEAVKKPDALMAELLAAAVAVMPLLSIIDLWDDCPIPDVQQRRAAALLAAISKAEAAI
jgi:hypothetical protein